MLYMFNLQPFAKLNQLQQFFFLFVFLQYILNFIEKLGIISDSARMV